MAEPEKFIQNRSANEDLLAFFDLVVGLLSAEKLLVDFVYMAGYDLGTMDKPNTEGVTTFDKLLEATRSTRTVYEGVREQWPDKWKSWDTAKSAFRLGKQVFEEYKKCRDVFALAGQENGLDIDKSALLLHVLEQVILRGHALLYPPAIQLYRLLDWVHVGKENEGLAPEQDTSGRIIRYPYRGIRFHGEGIRAFNRDPGGTLKKLYFNGSGNNPSPAGSLLPAPGPATPDDLLLVRLRDLLLSLNLNAFYGFRPADNLAPAEALEKELAQTLTTWFSLGHNTELALSMRRQNGRIFVRPELLHLEGSTPGQQVYTLRKGGWQWDLDFGAGLDTFSFGPGGVALPEGGGFVAGSLTARRQGEVPENGQPPEPAYRLGTEDGTRLELGKVEIKAGLDLSDTRKKADLEVKISQSGFHLLPGDGDSFLRKVLPEKGLSLLFDLSLGYSNERGFYLDGSGGGEILLPVNRTVGKITIPAMQLGLRKLSQDQRWMLYASLNGHAALGPIALELDKVGMRLLLAPPAPGEVGNLGLAEGDFDFKPPNGVGIQVQAKDVVTGGGHLYLDPDKGEYFGVAQLSVKNKIQVKALGIIQTRLPDGQPGFSFLLLVTAEFPAIQLGLGFKLTGVGGLVGIHRRLELEQLREGIYQNDLDDILFPADPLKNAYALVNKINRYFPPADGQHTFGLMAQLAWGPKNLVRAELGLILEFPEPLRLALVGVLRAEVIKKFRGKEFKALQLQVNFLAAIDFDKQFIRLDAALYQSKLLGLALEGEMALRLKYGANPDFAFTIGGFHPRFQPPALSLPATMRRLQLVLRSGNPSITVACYLALTSNTFQFGVAGLFVFKKWGVGIRGELSFDALFQFSPFRFETDLHLLLAASWKGYDFASIEVKGSFSGPSPWHLQGSLRLKVWIFSKTVSLDETWGDDDETPLEGVRILPLLAEDLGQPANWERAPGSTRLAVSLRAPAPAPAGPAPLRLHPNELLTVRQQTVPLGLRIERFGARRPEGADRFQVALLNPLGEDIPATQVKNHFASAQFLDLTDEQQLSAPPYELFEAGLSFEGLDAVAFGDFTTQPFEYEIKTLGAPEGQPEPGTEAFQTEESFAHSLRNNALANSALGSLYRPRPLAEKTIRETFVVAEQDSLQATETPVLESEAEARQLLQDLRRQDPRNRLRLTVLPKVEAVI
ncbi:MAG: DUF6603 domain-containing protein [Adhaeribacter sp.]